MAFTSAFKHCRISAFEFEKDGDERGSLPQTVAGCERGSRCCRNVGQPGARPALGQNEREPTICASSRQLLPETGAGGGRATQRQIERLAEAAISRERAEELAEREGSRPDGLTSFGQSLDRFPEVETARKRVKINRARSRRGERGAHRRAPTRAAPTHRKRVPLRRPRTPRGKVAISDVSYGIEGPFTPRRSVLRGLRSAESLHIRASHEARQVASFGGNHLNS